MEAPAVNFTRRWTNKLFAVLMVMMMLLAACGGSSDDGSDSAAEGSDTSSRDDVAADTDESTASAVAPDPTAVGQIGAAFLSGGLDEEVTSCLVSRSESDNEFAAAMNVLIEGAVQLDDAQFASIVLATRDCAGQDAFTESFAIGFSDEGQVSGVQECFAGEFTEGETDDLFVAFAAMSVGFAIPADQESDTIAILGRCITGDVLASQLAAQYAAAQGTATDVDADCVAEAIKDIDPVPDFWEPAVLTGDVDKLDAIDALVATCASGAFDDLLQEVPADFEPWAGRGALAAVAPPARAGAYSSRPPMTIDPSGVYEAVITTSDGEMVVELFAGSAPVTVNSFVNLARDGFYDGTVFHRVLPDFMAQGGDPTGSGSGGPGYSFEDEFEGGRALDTSGLLAMANSGPATNGSQFFITLADVDYLTGSHTVFGRLKEGDDVLSSIDLRDPANPTTAGQTILSIVIIEAVS
ncbi:MAG: peptidylprolyl isomerase [Candidatus Poriferisodalaceae bacterium]|jgi:peptidylprolyl isomerase